MTCGNPGAARRMLGLVLLAMAAARPAGGQPAPFDRWYAVTLGGDRVGHAHISVTDAGQGEWLTTMRMAVEIRRGRDRMRIEMDQEFRETADGRPVRAELRMRGSAEEVAQTLYFLPDGARRLVSRQGKRVQERELPPVEGEWMTPLAADRFVERALADGVGQFELRSIDLGFGPDPLDASYTVRGPERVEVYGRTVEARVLESRLRQMPALLQREHVDERGRMLRSTTEFLPGLEITLLAADETLALAPVDPPEILASLFLRPDRPIRNPRARRRLRFDLDLEASPPGAADLPSAASQRVEWIDGKTVRVTVDLDTPDPEPAGGEPGEAELGASILIDPSDPRILELLGTALGPGRADPDAAGRAERLRRFVHGFMQPGDLSVGLGSASEVARTRRGDCTEYSVLLAALLRADGIPSRTVMGVMYIEEYHGHRKGFLGHMWTQAWLPGDNGPGRWVDLDATLPGRASDAARIAFAVCAMEDGRDGGNSLVELSFRLSGLRIRVLDD